MKITTIPTLKDNYSYVITDEKSGCRAVVDPGEAAPILRYLRKNRGGLDWILLTHHHFDHVDGVAELTAKFPAKLAGPLAEKALLPPLDAALVGGGALALSGCEVRVIDVPGHTKGHIAFYFADAGAVFTGDSLFALGCGRLFEGDAKTAWAGLSAIKRLPVDTNIYFAHEYTMDNARFCLGVEPNNRSLRDYVAKLRKLVKKGKPTTPVLLADECENSPFLRGDDTKLADELDMRGGAAYKVFGEVRRRKDFF